MNSAFNQERQQQVGIERFEWSTSQDERVRESHAELDGKTFSWNDLPVVDDEEASPGTPICCRCVAIPVVDMEELAIGAGYGAQPEEEMAA
jgi:SPP1 gp7 family putative phage head morphogenesis protein